MILKHKDDLVPHLAELERLLSTPGLSKAQRDDIEDEMGAIRAGAKGEKEAAYHIDFAWKDGTNSVVIHDLRLEHKGRVAQIDHLIMQRVLQFQVIESKGFSREVRISEAGEWETKTRYGWRGIPSPVEQNRRHIEVLKSFIDDHGLVPKRLGMSLPINYNNWVLVSPACQLQRAGEGWERVVKMDMFETRFQERVNDMNPLGVFTALSKIVSLETLEGIAKALVAAHKPATFNFAAKFGIEVSRVAQVAPAYARTETAQAVKAEDQIAKSCDSCGAGLEPKVVNFCRANSKKFVGKLLCQPCQKAQPKRGCHECSRELEAKVIAFCRINSKRFAGRLLCRQCQPSAAIA